MKSDTPTDPVIEAYKTGIDRTLLRENLTRTLEQRIAFHDSVLRDMIALHEAGKRARAAGHLR